MNGKLAWLTSYLPHVLWVAAAAALGLLLWSAPKIPLPWFDETLLVSTALSVARGGSATPSVLNAFPHVARFDLLYGPVVFVLGSLDLKLFGVSIMAWRSLGWLGGVALTLGAGWMTFGLVRSQIAAAASAALVAWSQGMGARATCGRLDTVTVAFELLSLGFAVKAFDRPPPDKRSYAYSCISGLFCGLALASTPRSFPFVAGLGLALMVELFLAKGQLAWRATQTCFIGAFAAVPVSLWTLAEKTNPIAWLQFIANASQGDKINVSPLFGGSWHLTDGPMIPRLAGFCALLVLLGAIACALSGGSSSAENGDVFSWKQWRLPLIVTISNYLLTFLVIARFWDYEIFFIPLLLPVLAALTAQLFRTVRKPLRWVVLVIWLPLIVVLVGIRVGKTLNWLSCYETCDAAPLDKFVSEHVPAQALVFGPRDFYFYAAERAGAEYLYVHPWVAPGMLGDRSQKAPDWQKLLSTNREVFFIWPVGDDMPAEAAGTDLQLIAQFESVKEKNFWFSPELGRSEGYPPSNLYRVERVDSQDRIK